MDLKDVNSWATLITGAKNLFDIYDRVREILPSDSISPEIKRDMLGNEDIAKEQSSRLIQMVEAKTYPFLLRIGKHFSLPPDWKTMGEAIKAYSVWDWTYCFECNFLKNETAKQFREQYCDPEENGKFIKGASTTTLAFSDKPLPEEFGDTLYIAGIVIANVRYSHIYNISSSNLMPAVVVRTCQDGVYGINNPIAMNYYLNKATNFLFSNSIDFQRNGELCFEQPPKNRQLPTIINSRLNGK